MAPGKSKEGSTPPDGPPPSISEFDTASASARSIILAIGEMRADVRNLTKTVDGMAATVGALKSKVDFAHGAVWMLGLGMLVISGLFWLAMDNQIQTAVDKAMEKIAAAKPPTINIQMPEPAAPASPTSPVKPVKPGK